MDRVEVTSGRSNCAQMFFKTGILVLFRNIHKKTAVLESLLNKFALKFFIKKRLQHSYFLVNIGNVLRTNLVIEDWWLLLT